MASVCVTCGRLIHPAHTLIDAPDGRLMMGVLWISSPLPPYPLTPPHQCVPDIAADLDRLMSLP